MFLAAIEKSMASSSKSALDMGRRCARLAGLLSMLGLASCHEPVDRIVEQTFNQTCKVEPNARLTVRNLDGSIRIYGADTHEVKIEAIKKAYDQARLDKIIINVEAHATSVAIDTIYPPKPKFGLADRSGTVDYIIIVPATCTIPRLELTNGEMLIAGMRGGRVNANLVNGRLFDHNNFGAHELFVANGGLDIVYDWWEQSKFSVDAKIVNGNARAFLPGEAAFHLLAAAVDGNVSSDFSEKENRHRGLVPKIDAIVGGPSEVVIQLHATNGSIRVAEANP